MCKETAFISSFSTRSSHCRGKHEHRVERDVLQWFYSLVQSG